MSAITGIIHTMSVSPLNILVLGDSHIFRLDSFIRSDSLAERFGELQIEGRGSHVEYLGGCRGHVSDPEHASADLFIPP